MAELLDHDLIMHTALIILTQANTTISLKNRRGKAGWNPDYLEKLIRRTTSDTQAFPLN